MVEGRQEVILRWFDGVPSGPAMINTHPHLVRGLLTKVHSSSAQRSVGTSDQEQTDETSA